MLRKTHQVLRVAAPIAALGLFRAVFTPSHNFILGGVHGRLAPLLRKRSYCRVATMEVDPEYPGTSLQRLQNVHGRVATLTAEDLSADWEEVRKRLLWAGGLRDLRNAAPGSGYTGHAFNDDNHCDLTTMLGDVSHNTHGGNINGIAIGNLLGPGIEAASLPELGPGGSWSTCTNGCHEDPPQDVAHVQFRSRVAFKLVWCPPAYTTFVLVDDSGRHLNHGMPSGNLPQMRYRSANYALTRGGKYAREAEAFGMKDSVP